MEHRFSRIRPQKWVQVGLLLAFCFVVFFINLNQWDLWNPDEPRYGEIAREMLNRGDWILMHLNGARYGDKPPLFFWLIGLSSYLWNGFSSFAVRFPSAFFATLTVLLTFLVGKRLYGSQTGFLSGLILATSVEFAYLATRANIDATLVFFTTAALFCFLEWHQGRKRGGEKRRGLMDLKIYGFYISMALATLAKGPVGFILPLMVSLIFLAVRKDWKEMRRMKLPTGMLLFLAIVLSWYVPAVSLGGRDYLQETLFKHTVDAYAKGWTHVRPMYYYLVNFPADFLPWFLFFPAALVCGYRSFRKGIEKREEFLFLFIWFAAIFLFFSLSKGKRAIYILPLYPAASVMVGRVWEDFVFTPMEGLRHQWISFPIVGLAGVLVIAGVGLPWVLSAKFPSYVSYGPPAAFFFVAVGIALFLLHRLKYQGAVFFLIVFIFAVGFFYTLRVVFPLVNPYKSARFISQEITSRIQPGEKLGLYGGFGTGPFNFYTGMVPIVELEGEKALADFLGSPERRFCLIESGDLAAFQKGEGRPRVQQIARNRIGNNDISLISNR